MQNLTPNWQNTNLEVMCYFKLETDNNVKILFIVIYFNINISDQTEKSPIITENNNLL